MNHTTLVELRRRPNGVWEVRWQAPDGNIRIENKDSASDVANQLLRFGKYEFVRGLVLPIN